MWEKLGLDNKTANMLIGCGFSSPTEIQRKSFKPIMKGDDFVGGSATGSGKTLAFGLPAILKANADEKGTEVLVICPTRELACQVADEIKKVVNRYNSKIGVVAIYGGADFTRQAGMLIKGTKIVVGTPGRLLDHLTQKSLKLKKCKMLILDEADEMLGMGFRPDIEKIIAKFKQKPQMLLFSATMPKSILQLIDKYLQNPTYAMVDSVNRASQNVVQYYIRTSKNGKIEALSSLLKKFKGERALIFCNTKAMTENVSKHLRSLGYKSDMLNGDMSQKVRSKVLESFKSGNLQFLVCTDVASRGIDISNLPYVVNYDLPKVNEWYVHRIGRTGRIENSGKAYTIINKQEQYVQLKELATEMKFSLNELVLDIGEKAKVDKTIAKNIKKSNNMCEPSFKECDEFDDLFDLNSDDSYNTKKAKNNTANAKSNYFDKFADARRVKKVKGEKQNTGKKKNVKKVKTPSKKHSKRVEHSSKKAKKKIKK